MWGEGGRLCCLGVKGDRHVRLTRGKQALGYVSRGLRGGGVVGWEQCV